MRATLSEGPSRELELSTDAAGWTSLADACDLGGADVACDRSAPAGRGEVRLARLSIRETGRPRVLLSAAADRAVIEGSRDGLAQFARLLREFAAKSRRGQADPIQNRGPDHFIDPASILTLLHLGGEAAERKGDVGG